MLAVCVGVGNNLVNKPRQREILMKNDHITATFSAQYMAAAQLFVPKNDFRYYLVGVYVDPVVGGGVNLVGTDGHAIIVLHDSAGHASEPFIIDSKEMAMPLKIAAQSRPKNKQTDCINKVVVVDGMLRLEKTLKNIETQEIHSMWKLKTIEGTFPDYKRLFTHVDPGTNDVIMLNPTYLAMFKKALCIATSQTQDYSTSCFLNKSNVEKGVLVRGSVRGTGLIENIAGIVMQMRSSSEDERKALSVPHFLKRAKK